ncbi:MAG: 4-hydroxy-3-methylbut-2-enyl diphosphate reductase [Pseudomonadales bacterium]|jgi:4-hydroxy-3-methylbut-2-enyl diphosphate reductase|nr:4-hydroxy-3-methylbut-2-enyl diphosphate reductase [Pseudomonadales bacterium]
MQINIAKTYGFCGEDGKFGVSGAVNKAVEAGAKYPGDVYIIGSLVHNGHVSKWLTNEHGIKVVDSLDEVPSGKVVLVKAHGEPPSFYEKAQTKGIKVIDATCAVVTTAQKMLKAFVEGGKEVVYIASEKDHDEAIATCQQVDKNVTITTLDEVADLDIPNPENTVVFTQTTLSMIDLQDKLDQLKEKYPTLTLVPHLCNATTDRQKAVQDLAKENDIVIVVGAPSSSNSNRLRDVAQKYNEHAYIVDNASELKKEWFENAKKVGVTAGASTPEWILSEVIETIKQS